MAIQRNDPCPCGSGRKFKRCCKRAPGKGSELIPQAPPARQGAAGHAGPGSRPAAREKSEHPAWILKISLLGIEPEIWRRVVVSPEMTLFSLHQLIQNYGWYDEHLWAFRNSTGESCLGEPPSPRKRGADPFGRKPAPDARKVTLESCLERHGATMLYEYDFGDGWLHEIKLETVIHLPEPFVPTLLGGENPFPLEDCGGVPGYMRLQAVWQDGKDPHGSADFEEWASDLTRNTFETPRLGDCLESLSEANRSAMGKVIVPKVIALGERAPAMEPKLIGDLQDRLAMVLAEFDRDHGVKTTVSPMSYTAENGYLTVETATIRDDGIVMDRAAVAYLDRAQEFGLSPEWLGETFLCGKDHVRIIGLKPRAKESVLLETVTETGRGKERFKMHPERVPAFFAGRTGTASPL